MCGCVRKVHGGGNSWRVATTGNGYTGSVAEEGRTSTNSAEAGTSLLVWDRREERVGDESVQHSQVTCICLIGRGKGEL